MRRGKGARKVAGGKQTLCGLSVVQPRRYLNRDSVFLTGACLRCHTQALYSLSLTHLPTHTTGQTPMVPLRSWRLQSCFCSRRQTQDYIHFINIVWLQGLASGTKLETTELGEVQRGVKAKFTVLAQLADDVAFHGFFSLASLPPCFLCGRKSCHRPVSCHRPLSCGHFLVFCQRCHVV